MAKQRNVWHGMVSGVIGGLVGTWVMSELRTALLPPGKPAAWSKRERELRAQSAGPDDATKKVANAVAKAVLGRGLSKQEKATTGPLVHYATGIVASLLYSLVVEYSPAVDKTYGLALAVGMWAGDETIIPALGLTVPPQRMPLSSHLYDLASHLSYGLVADAVRRLVRG